jgi:hypothetical protein
MPKVKISEFSSTPGSNTDIDGINIAEGCAPSGINDAIRELMAQLKDFQTGAVGDSFNGPVGTSTAAAGAFTTLTASSTATLNTLASSGATLTGGSINGMAIGGTTAAAGAFTTLSATGVTTVQAGSAASPAITTTGDTNTGIFFPAADTIAFTEGGTESMRIDSSGNLLVGGTSAVQRITSTKGISANDAADSGIAILRSGTTYGSNLYHTYNSANGQEAFGITVNNNTTLTDAQYTKYLATSNGIHIWYGSTTATERARIDASGNLGLGVTPSAWGRKAIQIGDGAEGYFVSNTRAALGANFYFNSANYYIQNGYAAYTEADSVSGGFKWWAAPSGTAGNAISFTQAMTLDASGNLLVGRSTQVSGEKFVVEGATTGWFARLRNTQASGGAQGLQISYSAQSPNGTDAPFLFCEDSTALRMSVRSNGGIANFSANDVNLSDRREKTNFAPAKSYLETICAIPVQTFNYIDQNMEDDGGLTLGVVAQDVQAVAPELVMESNWGTDDNPKMRLSIYQTDLQYALMKCIQEQQAIITALTARVASLESK